MRIYHHAVVSVANHANTRVPTPASSVALINHPRTAGRCINSIIIYDRPTSPRYFSVLRVTRDCNSLSRLCARSIARYGHSRRSTPSTISSPSFCDAIFFLLLRQRPDVTLPDWAPYEYGRRLSRNRAQRFARLSRKIARLDPPIRLGTAGLLLIKSSDQTGLRSTIARVRLQRSNDSTRKLCEELRTASGIIRAVFLFV